MHLSIILLNAKAEEMHLFKTLSTFTGCLREGIVGNQWPAGTGEEKQRRELFILGSIVYIHIDEDSGHWPRHLQCPAVPAAKNNHRNVNPVRYEDFIRLLSDVFSLFCSSNRWHLCFLAGNINGRITRTTGKSHEVHKPQGHVSITVHSESAENLQFKDVTLRKHNIHTWPFHRGYALMS